MPACCCTVVYVVYVIQHGAIFDNHAYQGSLLVKYCLDKHAHKQRLQHSGKQLSCIVVGQVSIHRSMSSG